MDFLFFGTHIKETFPAQRDPRGILIRSIGDSGDGRPHRTPQEMASRQSNFNNLVVLPAARSMMTNTILCNGDEVIPQAKTKYIMNDGFTFNCITWSDWSDSANDIASDKVCTVRDHGGPYLHAL